METYITLIDILDVYQVEEVLRHPFYQNVMRYRDSGVLESEPRLVN